MSQVVLGDRDRGLRAWPGRVLSGDINRHYVIQPAKFATGLLAWSIILTLLSVTGHWLQYAYGVNKFVQFVRLFNISGEGNIPTWFSAVMLLIASKELYTISLVYTIHTRHTRVLSAMFALLSLDEVSQLHESSIPFLRGVFSATGPLTYAWVIPGAIFVIAVLAAYLGFLAALPKRTRVLFVVSGAIFVFGVLGMEFISGWADTYRPAAIILRGGISTTEDLLKMLGTVLFIYTLMDYRQRLGEYVGEERTR